MRRARLLRREPPCLRSRTFGSPLTPPPSDCSQFALCLPGARFRPFCPPTTTPFFALFFPWFFTPPRGAPVSPTSAFWRVALLCRASDLPGLQYLLGCVICICEACFWVHVCLFLSERARASGGRGGDRGRKRTWGLRAG